MGLNFADVGEADNFFAVVEDKISQRNSRFGIQLFCFNNFCQFKLLHKTDFEDDLLLKIGILLKMTVLCFPVTT